MEFTEISLIGLLMICVTSGQGTEGLSALADMIKNEVSIQVKIEGNAIKEEILKIMQHDREKQEENRRTLHNQREGNFILLTASVLN